VTRPGVICLFEFIAKMLMAPEFANCLENISTNVTRTDFFNLIYNFTDIMCMFIYQ